MFYTYAHIRNDSGQVFYIGKGSKRRAWTKFNRNDQWCRIAKKHGYSVKILSNWETAKDALSHEIFLIACLRDIGIALCNQTQGGEGLVNPTLETRQKMSARISEAHAKPETREKMSKSAKLKFKNQSEREKVSNGLRRHFSNESARKAQSERLKKYFSNPENRKKATEANQSNPTVKPVVCIETGEVFPSKSSAAKAKNIDPGGIYANIVGRTKRAGPYTWRLA